MRERVIQPTKIRHVSEVIEDKPLFSPERERFAMIVGDVEEMPASSLIRMIGAVDKKASCNVFFDWYIHENTTGGFRGICGRGNGYLDAPISKNNYQGAILLMSNVKNDALDCRRIKFPFIDVIRYLYGNVREKTWVMVPQERVDENARYISSISGRNDLQYWDLDELFITA